MRHKITLLVALVFGLTVNVYGRYYDAQTGRFVTPDPVAQKYPELSPYAYVANNPLKYVDPNGQWLVFAGNKETVNKAIETLNSYYKSTGFEFSATLGKDGNYSVDFSKFGNTDNFSEGQKAFYQDLSNAIGSNDVYGVAITENSAVAMDQFDIGQIDIGDIYDAFDGISTISPAAAFGHSLSEQIFKQDPTNSGNNGYDASHAHGVGVEEAIGGYKVQNDEGHSVNSSGTGNMQRTVKLKNGTTVRVMVQFEKGKVKDRSEARKEEENK